MGGTLVAVRTDVGVGDGSGVGVRVGVGVDVGGADSTRGRYERRGVGVAVRVGVAGGGVPWPRTKMSQVPLLSLGTRSVAFEQKAIDWPSAEIAGPKDLPLAAVPAVETDTSVV